MGQINQRKLTVLLVLFLASGALVYSKAPPVVAEKQLSLSSALDNLKGWESRRETPLDASIVESLGLDDYANRAYSNGRGEVSLFIGYYRTMKKLGATHSPLVCFPGQGWVISNQRETQLSVEGNDIHMMTMFATRGDRAELVLYWFHAFDETFPGTFSQKVHALWARIMNGREDNAFVRITVPMRSGLPDEAFSEASEFIKAFYPVFLSYVIENSKQPGGVLQ